MPRCRLPVSTKCSRQHDGTKFASITITHQVRERVAVRACAGQSRAATFDKQKRRERTLRSFGPMNVQDRRIRSSGDSGVLTPSGSSSASRATPVQCWREAASATCCPGQPSDQHVFDLQGRFRKRRVANWNCDERVCHG